MHRNLFLIVLSLIAVFWYDPQNLASSDFADAIPLLTGQSKTQTLNSSSGNPDIALGPNIDKYIKHCSDHNVSCDLIETLWKLEQCKYSWNTFKVISIVDFRIPEHFVQGIFDDFQDDKRVLAIKALIKRSAQREQKEAEEAEAAALNKPSVMDLSSFSSASLSDDSSSAVASVTTHPSGTTATPTLESCAAIHDTQLRQRKTAQSTAPTIPSH